jgi:uncharacterized protein (TIGR02246 family)
MDKAVQELLDFRAIEQLMVRYADRIDANDHKGAAACFAEDGVGKYWGEFKGRKAIADRLEMILVSFTKTSHHLSNVNIKLDGDKATSMSYVYAYHRMADSGEPMHYWGRWVDSFVRVDDEWFFAEKEVVGIDSIEPDGKELNHVQPGHPGRMEH